MLASGGLGGPACSVLGCPTDAGLGCKCNQSVRESCREGIRLWYLQGPYATVMDSGEPPPLGTPCGNHGIAGQASLGQLRPPSSKDRATAMQHGHVVSDVANRLDLTNEG